MENPGRGIRLAAGLFSLAGTVGIFAGEAARQQWKLSEFTWVKRQPAEAGAAANSHPAKLEPELLRQALAAVQFKGENGYEALFAKEELASLLESLREAFSLAAPGEDLVLLSTHRRGGSLFNTPRGLSARFFVQGGTLNMIVHDARLDFVDRYRGMQILPEFRFGSRATASAVEVKSAGARSHRADWLEIPLQSLPPEVATPKVNAAVLPTIDPSPAAKARDAAFYEEQEKRLRALKRMREENLITEEEYQQKRREILQAL